MATKLDRLLEGIHPDRTLEEANKRADEAINSFSVDSSQITDWDRYRDCLIRFLHHVDTKILRLQQACPMGVDFDWGRCTQILMRAYGSSGEKAAFEMTRTGNDGGLYAVLKKMAKSMTEQYVENEVSAKVGFYWDGLTVDEKLKAADEYLSKYGHLLPSELTEGSAGRIRANMPKVLQEHPLLLQRLGRIGRS